MQSRKFFTAFKTVFVNGTFIIRQKMTWNAVQYHQSIAAFLQVFIIEIFTADLKMFRKIISFAFVDVYHQAFTAIAAICTTHLWGDFFVKFMYHSIDLFIVMSSQKRPKLIVFRLFFNGISLNKSKICMEFDCFQDFKSSWYLAVW